MRPRRRAAQPGYSNAEDSQKMAIGFSGEPVPPGTLSGAPTNRKVQRFRLHPVLVLELYEQCCKLDLEGVVAKPKLSPYRELGGKPMLDQKIKNQTYRQAEGRGEFFNQRR